MAIYSRRAELSALYSILGNARRGIEIARPMWRDGGAIYTKRRRAYEIAAIRYSLSESRRRFVAVRAGGAGRAEDRPVHCSERGVRGHEDLAAVDPIRPQ